MEDKSKSDVNPDRDDGDHVRRTTRKTAGTAPERYPYNTPGVGPGIPSTTCATTDHNSHQS